MYYQRKSLLHKRRWEGRKEERIKNNNHKTNNKMALVSPYLPIVTLNVKRLRISIFSKTKEFREKGDIVLQFCKSLDV